MNCPATKVFIFDPIDGSPGDTVVKKQCQKPIGHSGAHFVMLPGNQPQSWLDDIERESGRAAEGVGPENRSAGDRTVGSNPTSPAKL